MKLLILAGGKGTRLDGKGKLNQKLNNKTLLEHVYDRIKNQFNLIAINVNDEKRSTDLELELIFDKFSITFKNIFAGILLVGPEPPMPKSIFISSLFILNFSIDLKINFESI